MSYETIGGLPSEAITYSRLIERLRGCVEDCYTLGHLRKSNDDQLGGQGFLAIGQMLELTCNNVTKLAMKGAKLS